MAKTSNKHNYISGLRTWVEVDSKKILNNYTQFRKLVSGKTKIMSVVKSNAYGHGLVPFAKLMEVCGVDEIAVDSIMEGLALRKNGIKIPILVLGSTLPDMLSQAQNNSLTLTVSSMEALDEVLEQKDLELKIHIKVDTGMCRQGFVIDQLDMAILKLKNIPKGIAVDGIYTHFAKAKNPAFPEFTKKQIDTFGKWQDAFSNAGFRVTAHCCATSGAILFPDAHFDMVRIGIGMYGLWPSPEVESFAKDKLDLKPALTWKTVISEVKTLPSGIGVGYDLTEVVEKGTKIAICPIGYWHGYVRALSGIGRVIVGGEYARILGRISMDMITIDVTNIQNIKRGDEVIILGTDGNDSVTADNVAMLADTVNYEIVTCINPKIHRIYLK